MIALRAYDGLGTTVDFAQVSITRDTNMRRVRHAHRYLLSAILVILTSSCTHAFEVTKGTESAKGLPFFLKKEIYRQHTQYEYSWLRVVLSQEPVSAADGKGEGKASSGIQSVREVMNNDENRQRIDSVEVLLAHLPMQPPTEATDILKQIRNEFDSLEEVPMKELKRPDSTHLRVVGNYVERVPVVDYSTVYYLNGKIPPFGSNNISAELAPDGTLAKSSTDATGYMKGVTTAIEEVLPVKEYATARWVPSNKKQADSVRTGQEKFMTLSQAANPNTLAFDISLDVEPRSIMYDFTMGLATYPARDTLSPVSANFDHGMFTARQIGPSTDKPSDGGISFTGTVTLPATKKP